MAGEQEYLTLTFVVRRPSELTDLTEVDFQEARALVTEDETQFCSVRPGVSQAALALGAKPRTWD